ncbi:MAG: DMT family transporter [Candidatus Cryptobacteroides sp.]|nr:DMT family transporter [Candidatus Cryptobacteroides sp.]
MRTEKLLGHLSTAAAYSIFGLNIVFCKDIANTHCVEPIVLFTLRSGGAALLFFLISVFLPMEKIERSDFVKIAGASVIGLFIPQVTFLVAISMATSIDTAIMSTLGPIFTMIFAFIFLGEPVTLRKAGGVALSFAGVIFLILNSVHLGGASSSTPLGIVLLLVNCLSFSLYLGLFRPVISKYSVVNFMKWSFLISAVLSLPFSMKGLLNTDFAAIPPKVCFEIGYLILCATCMAYFLIPFGQKRLRPTLVSMYTYLQPIIAAVVSISTGIDTLGWQKILATVLIISGVVLVSKSRAANSAPSQGSPD